MLEGEEWNLGTWLEAQQACGATHDDVRVHSQSHYYLANRGDVWTVLGWLWPHCPRWYLQFGDPVAREVAAEVVELRQLVKLGLGGSLGEELTPGGLSLLRQADRLWDRLQSDYERDQLEKAKGDP